MVDLCSDIRRALHSYTLLYKSSPETTPSTITAAAALTRTNKSSATTTSNSHSSTVFPNKNHHQNCNEAEEEEEEEIQCLGVDMTIHFEDGDIMDNPSIAASSTATTPSLQKRKLLTKNLVMSHIIDADSTKHVAVLSGGAATRETGVLRDLPTPSLTRFTITPAESTISDKNASSLSTVQLW